MIIPIYARTGGLFLSSLEGVIIPKIVPAQSDKPNLQDLGLSTQGNKPELLARLEAARGLTRQSPPVAPRPAR